MKRADLAARIDVVERRFYRRTWLIGGVGLFIIGLTFALNGVDAEAGAAVGRFERVELIDRDGNIVGAIGTDEGYYPYFELRMDGKQGQGGKVRMEVPRGVGAGFVLIDATGKRRAQLTLGVKQGVTGGDRTEPRADGQVPHLTCFDENQAIRVSLGCSSKDGTSEIVLRDDKGEVIKRLP